MSDLNEPKARILLARLDQQIDEQRLVLEQKDLRVLELAEEQANVERDIAHVEEVGQASETLASEADEGSITARRHAIRAHELALQVKGKRIRLLELDAEREQIAVDVAASKAHIAKLEAEVRQQTIRLKEPSHG